MKTFKKFSFGISFLVIFVLWASISYAAGNGDGGYTFSWITNGLSNYLLEAIAGLAVVGILRLVKPAIKWFEEKTGIDVEIKLKERIRNFVNAAKNRVKKSAQAGSWDEITFENEIIAEVMRMVTSTLPEYLNGQFSESWLKDLVTAVVEEENNKSETKDKKNK